MLEMRREPTDAKQTEVGRQKLHRLVADRRRVALGGQAPYSTGAFRSPPIDPIGEIKGAIRTEYHAYGENTADSGRVIRELEPRSLFLQPECIDVRRRGRAGVLGHEEVVEPVLAECRARVVSHAGRARMVVRDRREDVGGLTVEMRFEELLIHPHLVGVVALVRVLAVLPARAPPAVGPFDDVGDARLCAGLVTAGEGRAAY